MFVHNGILNANQKDGNKSTFALQGLICLGDIIDEQSSEGS